MTPSPREVCDGHSRATAVRPGARREAESLERSAAYSRAPLQRLRVAANRKQVVRFGASACPPTASKRCPTSLDNATKPHRKRSQRATKVHPTLGTIEDHQGQWRTMSDYEDRAGGRE